MHFHVSFFPFKGGTDLPSSEVDGKTAMEHGRRMIEALLKPMLSQAKARDVSEQNNSRVRVRCVTC